MIPPVRMEPSVPFAVPSREALALLRILVVAGEGGSGGGLLQNLRQWADDGRLEIDTAPDLPRAVRQLSGQRWDVVLAVLGEHPDDDLSWWVGTLRGATGSPRFIAVAQAPSMGLVLRAEKSGVLDVLALPLRREELVRALERVRSVVSETAVPLPLVEPHAVGPYALVGQSAAMLDVYKLLARVAGSSATVLVQGESGTGKEVVARAIHMNGPHASGAFVAVNCAAISRRRSSRGGSAKTCTIAWRSSRSGSPPWWSGETTWCSSPPTMSACSPNGTARRSRRSRTARWGCCAPTPGWATCASCAT